MIRTALFMGAPTKEATTDALWKGHSKANATYLAVLACSYCSRAEKCHGTRHKVQDILSGDKLPLAH